MESLATITIKRTASDSGSPRKRARIGDELFLEDASVVTQSKSNNEARYEQVPEVAVTSQRADVEHPGDDTRKMTRIIEVAKFEERQSLSLDVVEKHEEVRNILIAVEGEEGEGDVLEMKHEISEELKKASQAQLDGIMIRDGVAESSDQSVATGQVERSAHTDAQLADGRDSQVKVPEVKDMLATGGPEATEDLTELVAASGDLAVEQVLSLEKTEEASVEGEQELEPVDEVDTPMEDGLLGTPTPSTPAKGKKRGKPAKPKPRGKGGKVDKLRASAGAKRAAKKDRDQSDSATPAPSVDSFEVHTPSAGRDESPVDTSVYCICKKPYDEEDEDTVMIGCDRCDNWFHPACVKIAPDQIEMIDQFICVDCEQKTEDRTVFKVKCRRPECRRSVSVAASKYCSEACGMHHALGKLREKKLLFDDVYPAIAFAAMTESVQVIRHAEVIPSPPGPKADDLATLLSQIEKQEEAIAASRRVIEARRALLERAVANAEVLQVTIVPVVEAEEAGTKGKKKKQKKTPAVVDDRACGYNSRLAADDEVAKVLEEDGSHEVCTASRKCDRHQGWQRTIAVALEVEMALNARRQDQLAEQAARIKSGVERREQAKKISQAFRAARALPMDVHART